MYSSTQAQRRALSTLITSVRMISLMDTQLFAVETLSHTPSQQLKSRLETRRRYCMQRVAALVPAKGSHCKEQELSLLQQGDGFAEQKSDVKNSNENCAVKKYFLG